jgi:hypothetical protein
MILVYRRPYPPSLTKNQGLVNLQNILVVQTMTIILARDAIPPPNAIQKQKAIEPTIETLTQKAVQHATETLTQIAILFTPRVQM